MSNVMGKARKLARMLLRENRAGRSWRVIAKDDFQGQVNYATLNKLANSRGTWIPKDECILIALGLMEPHKPKLIQPPPPEWLQRVRKNIAVMARQTRVSLGLQK